MSSTTNKTHASKFTPVRAIAAISREFDRRVPRLVLTDSGRVGMKVFENQLLNCLKLLGLPHDRERALRDLGKLYNWTIVYRSFPGIKVPFISAIVDLDGGGTLKGNLIDIEPDPSKLTFDMPVTVVFSAVTQTDAAGSEFISYLFFPSVEERRHQWATSISSSPTTMPSAGS